MTPHVMLLAMAVDLGGAETHVVSLARGLARRGLPVTVVSAGGRLLERLQADGVRHRRITLNSRSPIALKRALSGVKAAMREESPDVLHAHARIPAWVADLARRDAGSPPLVTTYHGTYNAGWFWRRMSRWGDMAIAVSPEVREHLIHRLGVPPDRVTVIPNGVDTDHFRPAEPDAGPDGTGRPLIVHLSRLDEVIAPALALCEAVPRLADRWAGVTALILGGGRRAGEVARRAEAVNARLGREAVHLLGPTPDPLPHLASADAVVAAGRAALEAMACARPVVVAGAGGLAGAVRPDRSESLARTNFSGRGLASAPAISGADLAEALSPILASAELASDLGEFGRDLVTRRFSEAAMVEAVLDVYRTVIEADRPDRRNVD